VWKLLKNEAPAEWGFYFCWAEGWAKAEILEYSPSSAKNPSWSGFFNDCGAWPDVTHWALIEYPEIPKE